MSSTSLSSTGNTIIGLFLGALASVVYLLTLEPVVSFWDCGEFIATSYGLQIGHPPGAPFYTLLAHLFMVIGQSINGLFHLSLSLAWWSNALSAVSAGITVTMLYWSIIRLQNLNQSNHTTWLASIFAAGGACCYLFCDTAWFSAVESEVYSLSMAFSSTILWLALKWHTSPHPRYMLLVMLLLGLGLCVHLLSLLVMPAVLLIYLNKQHLLHIRLFPSPRLLAFMAIFFCIGLSPYLIIPIRAQANPPINEGNPSNMERFQKYLAREQYEKAPIWPRRWRHHEHDDLHNRHWSSRFGELEFLTTYQIGYMYGRYLLWNFSGRYNDRQGFGTLQNGQFLTGFPILDRQLVGTSSSIPKSLPHAANNIYFLLPLLLGLWGAIYQYQRNRFAFWTTLTLFLTSGLLLALYLNTPAYEPRERDYAYILSFYAFAIWIGSATPSNPRWGRFTTILPLTAVFLMGFQNWDDHDRHNRYLAHDAAHNILNTCDQDAILFTLGDNDTFPLWELQQVEHQRNDIRIENINLMGTKAFIRLLETNQFQRPVYFTHYAIRRVGELFEGQLRLEGFAYRLMPEPCDSIATDIAYSKFTSRLSWHPTQNVVIDEVSQRFIEEYWHNVVRVADALASEGDTTKATHLVTHTLGQLPIQSLQDPWLIYSILSYQPQLTPLYKQRLQQEVDYYHTLSPQMQRYIPYQLSPREQVLDLL